MSKTKSPVYQLILNRRSIRKFRQSPVSLKILKKLVNAGRLAPSGGNLQPLKFFAVNSKKVCDEISGTLAWAAYISPYGTPKENEQPAAYILVLVNTRIRKENYQWDAAAAMENMTLVATEEGLGSCWIGSINRPKLSRILNIPANFIIDSILALGYPGEKPKLEKLKKSCKYWKDNRGVLHVPKRNLASVIHLNKF